MSLPAIVEKDRDLSAVECQRWHELMSAAASGRFGDHDCSRLTAGAKTPPGDVDGRPVVASAAGINRHDGALVHGVRFTDLDNGTPAGAAIHRRNEIDLRGVATSKRGVGKE